MTQLSIIIALLAVLTLGAASGEAPTPSNTVKPINPVQHSE